MLEMTNKREEKYRELIEKRFSGVFKYISSEVKQDENDCLHYYITVECEKCGNHKTSTYMTFKKSNAIKCLCQDKKAIKKSIETYAVELYRSLYADSKEVGFVPVEDLKEYVRASAVYDRPQMIQTDGYIDSVYNLVLKMYKKNGVKPCECCRVLHAESNMYHYGKKVCKECHNENQEEKKKIRQGKERRKNRGLRA